jgi:hypothetical protein
LDYYGVVLGKLHPKFVVSKGIIITQKQLLTEKLAAYVLEGGYQDDYQSIF